MERFGDGAGWGLDVCHWGEVLGVTGGVGDLKICGVGRNLRCIGLGEGKNVYVEV